MRRMHGVPAVFVLALLLALLLAAGPASAATTPGTIHGYVLGVVYPGDPCPPAPDGSFTYTDYIAYGVFAKATGPDASLLLGYGVMRLDGVIGNFGNPNHFGDNTHSGDVVLLSDLPVPLESSWDYTMSYWENMEAYEDDWLWTGTWDDGVTHNNHNHQTTLNLDGYNALAGYHADIAWQSMVIDPNPTDHGPFIATPINATVWITSL
jgi:hypothetical protein